MRKSTATLAQVLTGVAAATLAYTLIPRHRVKPGSVVLVAGGSRGLGLAIADRFARAGARLVLCARNAEELNTARDLLVDRKAVSGAHNVLLIPADLTDPEQVANLVRQTIDHFGQIDILVNVAGVIEVGPFENQPLRAFEEAMQTNFFAALHTIQAATPHMLARFSATGETAAIVNISSIGGKFGVPHLLPYVASKFALTGFSEGLHAELRHKGIRVTTVCPGLMRTGSVGQARFTGRAEEEYRWFALSATTPGLATTASHAADKIFRAVDRGSAEITITPQAWLGARANGLAPGVTQFVSSLANQWVLPEPSGNAHPHLGKEVRTSISPRTGKLERENNQEAEPVETRDAPSPEADEASQSGPVPVPAPS